MAKKKIRRPASSRKSKPAEERPETGARPSWRGMISFGLVNVPVNLYTAVKPEIHGMNYLRKDDLCPISYKKVCRATGEEVPFSDIVKGYEYREGDFVVLEDADFRKADVKRTSAIEVAQFVDESEVDPRYIEKPYYLEPQEKAHTAYALFRDAMARSGKVGIGLFVLRDREHLVMLKPEGRVLMLIQLRFAATIRDTAGLDLPGSADVPKNQMELALELIKKFGGRPSRPRRSRTPTRRACGRSSRPKPRAGPSTSARRKSRARPRSRTSSPSSRRACPRPCTDPRGAPWVSRNTGKSGPSPERPSPSRPKTPRPPPGPRRKPRPAAWPSLSTSTGRPISTMTCASSMPAFSRAGPCPRALRWTRATGGWRSWSRTILSPTRTSTAGSPKANTARAWSRSETMGPTRPVKASAARTRRPWSSRR